MTTFKQKISGALVVLFPLMLLGGPSPLLAQNNLPQNLDTFVEKVRDRFEVPGIGLVIVNDDRIVLAKGYGIREIGKPDPVNKHTLFGIASNTKAFTATALGLLVEQGKIKWDASAINYLPWFRLADPYVTREITVRDLLVHRSGLGLGAGDLLWWPGTTYSRDEIVRRLRYVPLATSFRSAYAYDNVLYMVAGEVIEAVTGQSWEAFVATHILDEIGMNDSNVRHSDAAEGPNAATPHARIDGTVQSINPFTSDVTNPAGGINASAIDMGKWLITQLDSGRTASGQRLFTPRTTEELWSMVTPIPIPDNPPQLEFLQPQFYGYALGLKVRDYRGHKLVTHTGSLPGYVSKVTMVPELKLGIAVLTNQESRAAYKAITYYILDHYLQADDANWLTRFSKIVEQRRAHTNQQMQSKAMQRDSTAGPSLSPRAYAGTYTDAWYGDITIKQDENGSLVMRFSHTPDFVGDMEHWQYDTFIVRWRNRELRADAFVTFSLNPDGSIDHAEMKAVSPATDFSYDFKHLFLVPVSNKKTTPQ